MADSVACIGSDSDAASARMFESVREGLSFFALLYMYKPTKVNKMPIHCVMVTSWPNHAMATRITNTRLNRFATLYVTGDTCASTWKASIFLSLIHI